MAKSIEEIKDKLRKLFAMTEDGRGASPQEIETAMCKARKLMAEYKLSEADFIEKKLEVIKQMLNITFSMTVNPWIQDLNQVIADNYCCRAVTYTSRGARTKNAGLVGFEDDVDLAAQVMQYAVDCAKAEGKEIRKTMLATGYTNKDATSAINAWGNGFVRGISDAFEEQQAKETESFAMVMLTPQEVSDVVDKLRKRKYNNSNAYSRARQFDNYAAKGYKEGKKFSTRDKLAG